MPVRIYTLAKELKLDSADLVTICTKAGVTGKGSPLASLTDDEVAKLKSYLAGKAAGGTAAKPAAPVRPGAAVPAADGGALRREDYIAPTGTMPGKPPSLDAPKPEKAPVEVKKRPVINETLKAPPRTGPAIKLARLPTAQTPPPSTTPEEPAPQKPDLKLPADAIRAGKTGSKPLSEHLRKHEEKRKTDVPKPRGPRVGGMGPMPPAAPPEEGAGKEQRRRGGKHAPAAKGAAGGDDFASSLGGREARQLNRKRAAGPVKRSGDEDEPAAAPRRILTRLKRSGNVSTAAPRKTKAILDLPATVRSFSEAIGVPAREVLGKLLAMNRITTIGADLDEETIELLALELGVELEVKKAVDVGGELIAAATAEEDDPESMQPRPPVITFLGHVDHGKTSLLDKIIGIDVVSGESGGITQHIRAYEIERNGHKISFVDTPGHEAFTAMRARGANVTDIAVLVVAADDGVMPQTEEAISHARAAGVPIVIALNKIDLPGVNENRIFEQLAQNELLPTEWGGDTELVRTSATTGRGIDQLLETLLTIAELHDWKANPDRPAVGTCLEAEVHEGRGVVAKLMVQKGTLRIGDAIVCGAAAGHVKAMYDTLDANKMLKEAGPSTPINVTGFDEAPAAGEHFYVLDDIGVARQIADKRRAQSRKVSLGGGGTHVTLETLFDRLAGDEFKTLNIIIRADVRGSIEAIRKELTKLEHPEVKIKVLQATVGGVSEADVHLADASDAIIIGFNVVPDEKARLLAERQGVQVRRYDIIYRLTEDLKAALEGMLKPEERETELGRALVQRTFTISRVGTIAGCRVLSGVIQRNARMRIIRDNRILGDYALDSLKREKDDAREVREGLECGIKLAGFNDVKEGDVLEAYKIEEVARTF